MAGRQWGRNADVDFRPPVWTSGRLKDQASPASSSSVWSWASLSSDLKIAGIEQDMRFSASICLAALLAIGVQGQTGSQNASLPDCLVSGTPFHLNQSPLLHSMLRPNDSPLPFHFQNRGAQQRTRTKLTTGTPSDPATPKQSTRQTAQPRTNTATACARIR